MKNICHIKILFIGLAVILLLPVFVGASGGHAKAYPVKKNESALTDPEVKTKPDYNEDLEILVQYPDNSNCDFEMAEMTPVDPGDKGKESIIGVDSDGDCIRDDLEIFIKEKLPNEEEREARRYLYIRAIWLGELLRDKIDTAKAYEISNNLHATYKCVEEILGDTTETNDIIKRLFSKNLNTYPRSFKYIENNSLLGGISSRATITVVCN